MNHRKKREKKPGCSSWLKFIQYWIDTKIEGNVFFVYSSWRTIKIELERKQLMEKWVMQSKEKKKEQKKEGWGRNSGVNGKNINYWGVFIRIFLIRLKNAYVELFASKKDLFTSPCPGKYFFKIRFHLFSTQRTDDLTSLKTNGYPIEKSDKNLLSILVRTRS